MGKHNLWALVTGVLLILASLIIFVNPLLTSAMLGIYIGVCIVLAGGADIARYFMLRNTGAPSSGIAWGVFSVICGVFLLSGNLFEQAALVPYIMAFWLLVIGAGRCAAWNRLRKLGLATWHTLALGGLILLLGVFMMLMPWLAAVGINFMLGTGVLLFGVSHVVDFFVGKKSVEALPGV